MNRKFLKIIPQVLKSVYNEQVAINYETFKIQQSRFVKKELF